MKFYSPSLISFFLSLHFEEGNQLSFLFGDKKSMKFVDKMKEGPLGYTTMGWDTQQINYSDKTQRRKEKCIFFQFFFSSPK